MISDELREQLRQQGYDVEDAGEVKQPFPAQQFFAFILKRFHLLLLLGVGGLLLGTALGLLRHKKFTATIQLMPPDAAALSGTSTLAALSGNPLAGGLGGGGLLSARTPGGTIMGILGSPAVQDPVLERFHLMRVFGAKYTQDGRLALSGITDVSEDKKSGILSVAVTYKDPALARDIANSYIALLDDALSHVNTSTAHRERVFLEERLLTLKVEIDDLAQRLSSFSTSTGTLNPQAQGQALFEAVAKVQTELGLAKADLSSLGAVYTEDNTRTRATRARIASLQAQLAAMSAPTPGSLHHYVQASEEQPVTSPGGGALPTIRQLPTLGVTYTNLSQRLTAEQGVYATLTRQYELARVEESKQIPSVKVLSAAQLPQKPSSPSVLVTALVTCFGFVIVAFIGIALFALLKFAPASTPFKAAIRAMMATRANSAA